MKSEATQPQTEIYSAAILSSKGMQQFKLSRLLHYELVNT